MATDIFEELGPPDIKIAGLCVWVLGRKYDESQDYWDDWANVCVHCGAGDAQVRVSGAILEFSDLQRWFEQASELHRNLSGTAELNTIEEHLNARIELRDGRGNLVVDITPDHLTQQHQFTFEIDQSYLPELIRGLDRLLQQYPVRGKPEVGE